MKLVFITSAKPFAVPARPGSATGRLGAAIFAVAIWLALLPGASLKAAERITFQLDWLPGGDKAPVYVGIAEGLFAAQDLDVQVVQGRGSSDAMTRIATGQADIGLADITALMIARAEENIPVKAVYAIFSQAPHAFYVRGDSGIESVGDLAGKRIATSAFTSSNLFLPLLLEKNGVGRDQVELIQSDPSALGPLLFNRRADAIISWVTDHERQAENARAAGTSLRMIPWYEAGLGTYATALIASEGLLQRRPDVVGRFVTAYAQAMAHTWAHPEQAAAAVNQRVPEVDLALAKRTIEFIEPLVFNRLSAAHGLGVFDAARLAATWQWTAAAQQIDPSRLDPESVIDRRFAPPPPLP